jgi:acyl-coenzyme A thioesterase PaaI-like protein
LEWLAFFNERPVSPKTTLRDHMTQKSVQDYYPDQASCCYGCGRLNQHGLHIQSNWEGDDVVCAFTPREYHTSFPGYVYGGLIASLIDCHSIGTAAAVMYRAENRAMDTLPAFRFVTASLKVDFLKPTPIGTPLTVRARAKEIKGRKVIVSAELSANDVVCAHGEVVAVQMPETMMNA